jgi:hypothetical protein
MSVYVVDVDEGNNEGVCDDVLGYGKNRDSMSVSVFVQCR